MLDEKGAEMLRLGSHCFQNTSSSNSSLSQHQAQVNQQHYPGIPLPEVPCIHSLSTRVVKPNPIPVRRPRARLTPEPGTWHHPPHAPNSSIHTPPDPCTHILSPPPTSASSVSLPLSALPIFILADSRFSCTLARSLHLSHTAVSCILILTCQSDTPLCRPLCAIQLDSHAHTPHTRSRRLSYITQHLAS